MLKIISILVLVNILFAIKAIGQIPNSSFENWDSVGNNIQPISWNVTQSDTLGFGVSKELNAYSGDYAIGLSRAHVAYVIAYSNFPLSGHPHTLKGWFQAQRYWFGDSLTIAIELYDNHQLVDSGFWLYPGNEDLIWTPFSISISSNSLSADSAIIILSCIKNGPQAAAINLLVDELYFDDDIGIFSPYDINYLEIIPNPSISKIAISNLLSDINQFQLTIINELGQHYERGILKPSELSSINISDLPQGIYEMVLQSKQKKWIGKFIKL